MKLDGSWYISVDDSTKTSTHGDATDVEILEYGNWVRFISAGKLYITNSPVTMRTNVSAKKSE
jgi:hypothetical protein